MFGCCLQAERTIAIRKRKFFKKFCVIHNALCRVFVAIARGRLKTQVRKTKVPEDGICKYGIRKYSNLKSILKSLRFSSLAFSVDPLSVGLDQFTCTVPDRCYTQEIGLMLDSCAEGPGFKNRRRDTVE